MKIFGYEFRKFEQQTTTLEMIETWNVRWESLHRNFIDKGVPVIQLQGFTTKDQAKLFAKELTDARRLLGDEGWQASVYKQKSPTNL